MARGRAAQTPVRVTGKLLCHTLTTNLLSSLSLSPSPPVTSSCRALIFSSASWMRIVGALHGTHTGRRHRRCHRGVLTHGVKHVCIVGRAHTEGVLELGSVQVAA